MWLGPKFESRASDFLACSKRLKIGKRHPLSTWLKCTDLCNGDYVANSKGKNEKKPFLSFSFSTIGNVTEIEMIDAWMAACGCWRRGGDPRCENNSDRVSGVCMLVRAPSVTLTTRTRLHSPATVYQEHLRSTTTVRLRNQIPGPHTLADRALTPRMRFRALTTWSGIQFISPNFFRKRTPSFGLTRDREVWVGFTDSLNSRRNSFENFADTPFGRSEERSWKQSALRPTFLVQRWPWPLVTLTGELVVWQVPHLEHRPRHPIRDAYWSCCLCIFRFQCIDKLGDFFQQLVRRGDLEVPNELASCIRLGRFLPVLPLSDSSPRTIPATPDSYSSDNLV